MDSAEPAMRTKPLIVVVDDDPAILQALDRLIRSHGCAARTFGSGSEFLEFAGTTPLDCVIIDIQMPGQGGLEVYGKLRSRGLNLPVIFITAHEDRLIEDQCQHNGALGFFYKPFRNEVFWKSVSSALAKAAGVPAGYPC
jgi:FixJ family two-component response regulator